jgi:hypothetical protein
MANVKSSGATVTGRSAPGYRSAIFEFDGIAGQQLPNICWLLKKYAADWTDIDDMIDPSLAELMAKEPRTPLQIEQYLALLFEEAFQIGERPVSPQIVEGVLVRHLEDSEPRLTRHGYTVRMLAEQFSAKLAEIRQFLRRELDGARPQQLSERMCVPGLPI